MERAELARSRAAFLAAAAPLAVVELALLGGVVQDRVVSDCADVCAPLVQATVRAALLGLGLAAVAAAIVGLIALIVFVVRSHLRRLPRRGALTFYWTVSSLFLLLAAIGAVGLFQEIDNDSGLLLALAGSIGVGTAWLCRCAARVRALPDAEWADATQSLRETVIGTALVIPFFAPDYWPEGSEQSIRDGQAAAFTLVGVALWLLLAGPARTRQIEIEVAAGLRSASASPTRVSRREVLRTALAWAIGADIWAILFLTLLVNVGDPLALGLLAGGLLCSAAIALWWTSGAAKLGELVWTSGSEFARQVLALHVLCFAFYGWQFGMQIAGGDATAGIGNPFAVGVLGFISSGLILLIAGRGYSAWRRTRAAIRELDAVATASRR